MNVHQLDPFLSIILHTSVLWARAACIKPQQKNPQSISFSTKKYSVDFFPPPTFSLVGMLSWSKSVCAFPLVYRLISSHLHLFKFTSSREVNLSILINIGKNDFFFSHPNLKLINFFSAFIGKECAFSITIVPISHITSKHELTSLSSSFSLFLFCFDFISCVICFDSFSAVNYLFLHKRDFRIKKWKYHR